VSVPANEEGFVMSTLPDEQKLKQNELGLKMSATRDPDSTIEFLRMKRAKLAHEAKQIIDFVSADAEVSSLALHPHSA
jgi:hypothetical protein